MRAGGWPDLHDWQIDRGSSVPIFRQIYLQVRLAVLSRVFAPGTRLPSTRELAASLSVARASVVAAYDQLFAEGYLAGKTGSGTYVCADLPEPIDRGPSKRAGRGATHARAAPQPSFGRFIESTVPDDRPFYAGRMMVDVRTVEAWRKLTNRGLRSFGAEHLGYSDPRGLIALRTAICEYLQAARAVQCEPEQIVVTAGTQQSVDILIRALLARGDETWVEDPGYPLIQRALAAAGLTLRPIPVDVHGMDVAAGIRLAPRARAVFVTPSHQFPMGVVLSMARRLQLLAWARDTGAWIVEDDYANEFRYSGRPLASLQGLDDDGRVIYLGTLNKTLFPGLRIGYAVLPRALLPAFVDMRCLIDRQPPSLTQTILAAFMREGHLAAHIRRIRLQYRDRRDTLVSELERQMGSGVTLDLPDQGIHLVAYLDGVSDVGVEQAAHQNGVVVRAMSPLYQAAPARSGLILGFTGYPRQSIIPAVARLAKAIRSQSRSKREG